MISITALLNPQTSDQVRAGWVTALKKLGIPADLWKPGGVASTILTVVAITFAAFQNLIVQAIGASFLETATGLWLQLLAINTFGIDPVDIAATFANGKLTLTNAGGGTYNYPPFGATFQNPTTKVTYTNTDAIALPPGSTQTFAIQATIQGSAGNSPAHGITTLVTVMLGVTSDNAASVVGQDALDDPSIRILCQNKLGILSVRGPRTAYLYAIQTAINATTGARVNINRIATTPSTSTGVITIYVASPSGVPTSDDVTAAAANVEAIARPDCVVANVLAVTGVAYGPSLTVWANLAAGVTAAALQTAILASIADYMKVYPIGGKTTDAGRGLFATGIDSTVGAAAASLGCTIISIEGSTDLGLTDGQVATNSVAVTVRAAT